MKASSELLSAEPIVVEQRKLQEREHAEQRYSGHFEHEQNRKYYSVARRSSLFVDSWISENCGPGRNVLDYCCGTGSISMKAASAGGTVTGVDISPSAIKHCIDESREKGFFSRCSFYAMDAENLTFDDNSFDAILCMGVLHHLDLEVAYRNLARVLRPNGQILCLEALGHNPLIQLYRNLTPQMRTEWEKEHILTMNDIKKARAYFHDVKISFFHLATLLAAPLRKTSLFGPALSACESIDSILLKCPFIQKQAWMSLFVLSHPKKS
jgi:2-polyprenyl-3-methyl-5-hydroxy-6-metoxy-1,4-benzoquinol methylase